MRSFAIAFMLSVLLVGGAKAESVANTSLKPNSPTILTVSGQIAHTNRGPTDPFRDRLFAFHDIKFDRAMCFDRDALVALGMHSISVSYPKWPGGHRFEGPLLRDVLAKAGAKGGVLHPLGLDGYSAEIPVADSRRYDVILALKMDGNWLDLGSLGPAWILYPYDAVPELRKQDDAKWVWGVFHIKVDPR